MKLLCLKLSLFLPFVLTLTIFAQDNLEKPAQKTYTYGQASRDGIGKFYMGREISKVMGHLGASWLERPKREQEERTDLLVKGLNLKPSDTVADIGAGSGYFSFRMAKLVPQGQVFAVDISPQMIGIVRSKMAQEKVNNVVPVQSTIKQTKLPPNSVDAALIVDAYHEFSHPLEMASSILTSLKPGGKLILIEYRMEDPSVPIKLLHKMTEKQAKAEMKNAGFEWEKTLTMLPQQHFMIFRKPK